MQRFFLYFEDKLLGILLLGVNRPIWAGSTSSVVPEVIKPKKADEGLRPVAGSGLVAVEFVYKLVL